APHHRVRLVQPRDAGARDRGAGGGRLSRAAHPAVRHVPADPPRRVRGHAGALETGIAGGCQRADAGGCVAARTAQAPGDHRSRVAALAHAGQRDARRGGLGAGGPRHAGGVRGGTGGAHLQPRAAVPRRIAAIAQVVAVEATQGWVAGAALRHRRLAGVRVRLAVQRGDAGERGAGAAHRRHERLTGGRQPVLRTDARAPQGADRGRGRAVAAHRDESGPRRAGPRTALAERVAARIGWKARPVALAFLSEEAVAALRDLADQHLVAVRQRGGRVDDVARAAGTRVQLIQAAPGFGAVIANAPLGDQLGQRREEVRLLLQRGEAGGLVRHAPAEDLVAAGGGQELIVQLGHWDRALLGSTAAGERAGPQHRDEGPGTLATWHPPRVSRAAASCALRGAGGGRRLAGFRRLGVGGVAAILFEAADAGAGLGDLLDHELGAALRAGLRQRAIPGDEVTLGLRVVRAAEEHLAAPRALLGQVPAAAFLGAVDPQRDGAGGLAVRVARAGQELAEPSALDDHGRAAGRADLVGRPRGRHHPQRPVGVARVLLGVAAVRIAGASQEVPVAPPLDDHGLAALLADLVGRLLLALDVAHLDLGLLQVD